MKYWGLSFDAPIWMRTEKLKAVSQLEEDTAFFRRLNNAAVKRRVSPRSEQGENEKFIDN
jgi:hypothetical protein